MHELGQQPDNDDRCWRGRYGSAAEVLLVLRRSAEHRVDGSLSYYLDVSGHDGDGELTYRIVPVLHVN